MKASGIAAQGKNFGDLTLTANTNRRYRVDFALDSNLAEASIHGRGNAALSGDYPVTADVSFTNVTWSRLAPLLSPAGEPPSFDAVVDGQAALNGPIAKSDKLNGSLKLTRVNLTAIPQPGVGRRPFAIQNQGPISLTLADGTARIDSLHLTGPNTDLQAHGSATLQGQALDLSVNANGNLAVLKQLNRDFVSSGSIALAATVRGDLLQAADKRKARAS